MSCKLRRYHDAQDAMRGGATDPISACDGEYHYRILPDGREYVMADRIDGKLFLRKCPAWSDSLTEARASAAESEDVFGLRDASRMTFAAYRGNPKLVDAVRHFVEQDRDLNLVLIGKARVGKTHLCRALEAEMIQRHRSVAYITWPELDRTLSLSAPWQDSDDRHDAEAQINRLAGVGLLIIDDLGDERPNPSQHAVDMLKELLDRLPGRLMVTSNFDLIPVDKYAMMTDAEKANTLNNRVGDKVSARLLERSKRIVVRDARDKVTANV